MPGRVKYTFDNLRGESLAGLLETPATQVKAYALFAHCFTCTKDIGAASRISRGLAERGFAVLRFDFSGLGHSEGDFANSNFTTDVEDLVAAADSLRKTHAAPRLIIGHSLGGSAALAAAGKIAEIQAVATIAAPSDPEHINKHYEQEIAKIEQEGRAVVSLGGRPFTITREFLKDVKRQKLLDAVSKLRKPLLIFHSPLDDVVDIEHARLIYQAAKHPKSFISLDGADHLIRGAENSQYVADTLAAWAARYVKSSIKTRAEVKLLELDEGEVVVEELGQRYTQRISSKNHQFLADEPENLGGADKGMTPYELLLAALGGCTSMTLRMYADHKKINMGLISVRLSHQKHDGTDLITREIKIKGGVDSRLKERLLYIAGRCPVHKTIHGEIEDKTVILD